MPTTDTAETTDTTTSAAPLTTIDNNPDDQGKLAHDDDIQEMKARADRLADLQSGLLNAYLAALANFQEAMGAPSPSDAQPNVVGAALKAGAKVIAKEVASQLGEAMDLPLKPLLEVATAISDEVDRAAQASTALSLADWIQDLRANVLNANAGTDSRTTLFDDMQQAYNSYNNEDDRLNYIASVQEDNITLKNFVVPAVQTFEVALSEGWINANFADDVMEAGVISVVFDDDGNVSSATVECPLGDKVAGLLNRVMTDGGCHRLMDLAVHKRLTQGTHNVGVDDRNQVTMDTTDSDASTFLSSQDTWNKVSGFTS